MEKFISKDDISQAPNLSAPLFPKPQLRCYVTKRNFAYNPT